MAPRMLNSCTWQQPQQQTQQRHDGTDNGTDRQRAQVAPWCWATTGLFCVSGQPEERLVCPPVVTKQRRHCIIFSYSRVRAPRPFPALFFLLPSPGFRTGSTAGAGHVRVRRGCNVVVGREGIPFASNFLFKAHYSSIFYYEVAVLKIASRTTSGHTIARNLTSRASMPTNCRVGGV